MDSSALSLFDENVEQLSYLPAEDILTVVAGDPANVPGLSFYPEFITSGEERVLLWQADRDGEWSTHWSRRTKSFGAKYLSEKNSGSKPPSPMPQWSDFVRLRFVEQNVLKTLPNQLGINEYMPGQGIAPHIDHFGETIISLTLGSGCVMDISSRSTDVEPVSVWLPRRSIIVLQREARFRWRHGIKGRLKDIVDDQIVRRDRRVSLTFRNVVEDLSGR